jgi:hypothetical protein
MKPTIGRVVIYNTTQEDREKMRLAPNCNVQEKLPAIIVAVFGEHENSPVNLTVICDGELTLWKTSVHFGDEEMNWNWPVIQK